MQESPVVRGNGRGNHGAEAHHGLDVPGEAAPAEERHPVGQQRHGQDAAPRRDAHDEDSPLQGCWSKTLALRPRLRDLASQS